jgi:protein required for attachment to host cells
MAPPKASRSHALETGEILVVVFDGARARFFRYWPNGQLAPLQEMESGLNRNNQETVSDKPGRSFASSGSGVRHSIEPKHDPHKMEKHNFVHAIVKLLEDAYDHGKFERLAIVAPKRSLGEFRELASSKLHKLIWREVAKDLTHYSNHELTARLASDFAPEKEIVEPGPQA